MWKLALIVDATPTPRILRIQLPVQHPSLLDPSQFHLLSSFKFFLLFYLLLFLLLLHLLLVPIVVVVPWEQRGRVAGPNTVDRYWDNMKNPYPILHLDSPHTPHAPKIDFPLKQAGCEPHQSPALLGSTHFTHHPTLSLIETLDLSNFFKGKNKFSDSQLAEA